MLKAKTVKIKYCATYQVFKAIEYQVKTIGTSCLWGRKAV